jgi:hypothetical protein
MYGDRWEQPDRFDSLGLTAPFADEDPATDALETQASLNLLPSPFADEAFEGEFDKARARATAPDPAYLGGLNWTFVARTGRMKVAVFVPKAALGQSRVELMLYIHGLLSPCGGLSVRPGGLVTSRQFRLGKIVDDCGRPMVLVIPLMQGGDDKSWTTRGLHTPAGLNALVAEVLAEVGTRQNQPGPDLSSFIVAGHSRAYGVLYPLARSHASKEHGTGALARLSQVWLLDATYGTPPVRDFKTLVDKFPALSIAILYRRKSATDKFNGKAQEGRLAYRPIEARSLSHCAVPAQVLPGLLQGGGAVHEELEGIGDPAQFAPDPSWQGATETEWLYAPVKEWPGETADRDVAGEWLETQDEGYSETPGPFDTVEGETATEAAIHQARCVGKREDIRAVEDALTANNTSIESWFAKHRSDATFLGVKIKASGGKVDGVHQKLLDALQRAEKLLLAQNPGLSVAEVARKMNIHSIVGLRPPKKATGGALPSLHCFGLAIDINHPTNPFVGNSKGKSSAYWKHRSPAIIRRAMWLLRGEKFNIESPLEPHADAVRPHAGAVWDIHDRASRTLAEYLRLADRLDTDRVRQLVEALQRTETPPTQEERDKQGLPWSLEEWKERIKRDRELIKYYDFQYHEHPERGGYMDLPRALVVALTDAGLGWGGQYKGAKDMMHFGLEAIERPARNKSKASKEASDSGDEPETEQLAWLDFEAESFGDEEEPWPETEELDPAWQGLAADGGEDEGPADLRAAEDCCEVEDSVFEDAQTYADEIWHDDALRALASAGEFETPDPMSPYRIQGGQYTPKQRWKALKPNGLILTASCIGREEKRLVLKGPTPINIGKELTNFENGKLAAAVARFNAFTYYFDEILRSIGRLRDLLSAGAPEAPKLMTPLQDHALRPTNDRSADGVKNLAYNAWRGAQTKYVSASKQGRLNGGAVYDVADTARKIIAARYDFWQAHGDLSRTAKAALSAPEFEALSLSMTDVASVVFSGSVTGAATAGLSIGIDLILEARKSRKEYDAQMKKFEEAIRTRKSLLQDELATYRSKGEAYWNLVENLQNLLENRDAARHAARIAAGHFGRQLPARSERRTAKLAEIRMPAHVADAWRVLAIVGPAALAALEFVIKEKPVVDRARFHYMRSRPIDRPSEDIVAVTNAYNQAISWTPVLNEGQVRIWVGTNEAWDRRFNEFNV